MAKNNFGIETWEISNAYRDYANACGKHPLTKVEKQIAFINYTIKKLSNKENDDG